MKILYLTLSIFFLLFGKSLYAQNACKVNGHVVDSTQKALENITIKLISDKDSILTTSDAKGYFSFAKVSGKQITVRIGSMGFRTYVANYTIKPDMQEIDLGTITLKTGEINLPDVVIRGKPIAIKYKQDTVEYDAAAFHVQEEDRVTDLLRQLPGVEIDENENVTAMGKSMTKLRVNGRDFFTSDVKDFINKLPAEIVAKIQVIDDYGDQANFTGIKAGESNKMLNIVTKPGMDKGKFGGLSTRAGTNKQIGGSGNVSLWNGTKQSSGSLDYGIANNGAGTSENRSAGLSYNNKVGKNTNLQVNYNYNGSNNDSESIQLVETVNTLGKLNSRLENASSSANGGQSINLYINQTSKKIYLTGGLNVNYNHSKSQSNSFNSQTGFSRQDFKNNSDNSNRSPSVRAHLDFSKKLKKNSLSGNFSFYNATNSSDRNILTNTLYYSASGVLEKDSLLNRTVNTDGNNKQLNLGLNYSFFLKRDTISMKSLTLAYRGSVNITESDLQTFVLNPLTLVSAKVDSLSVFTQNTSVNQTLNLGYYQSSKKDRLNAGVNIQPNQIKNFYPELNSTFQNNYINLSPSLNYSRTINSSKSLGINYSGQNNNPSIFQLQPVKNTQNLQNIVVGNPNLKSSFSHSISASYNYFGKKSNISIQTGFAFSSTSNEIVNNIIIIPDTLGAFKQETRFENVNGNYNTSLNYNLNIPFSERKYSLSISGSGGNSRKTAIVDNEKSFNTGINFSQNISASFNTKKFNTNVGIGYNFTTNNDNGFGQFPGIQTPTNLFFNTGQSFFTTKSFNGRISASLRLKTFRLNFNSSYNNAKNNNNSSNASPNLNTRTQSLNFGSSGNLTFLKSYNLDFSANKRINKGYNLTNVNPLLINLGIGKSFLKSKSLNCSLNVSDLLNEGNNISQSVVGNSIIESRNNQVKRVVSLGLNYNLSNFGGKNYRLRTD
ncbi:outer membrane beta-barrel protein [Pedobacter agri]|uniref:outer membrane beta-barrel protein n=1 Tax=Pedobacter agri TaxID=454586 RepID=UPI00292FF1BF|nr:outer membrane beta-barrel protein [Pedobacter agri]